MEFSVQLKALENKGYLMLPQQKRRHSWTISQEVKSVKKKEPEKMIMDGKNTNWSEIENKLQGHSVIRRDVEWEEKDHLASKQPGQMVEGTG